MKKSVIILLVLLSSYAFSQSIVLDPNTSFFSPKGTLKLFGQTTVNDAFNNNKHYERIGRWKIATDTIVWGVKDLEAGTLNIELFAGISALENNSEVTIFLNNQQQDLIVNATSSLQDFQSQGSVNFQITQSGFYEVKIKIKTQNSNNDFGEIEKMILTGSAIDGATIYKRRWRPSAIHGKFLSPNNVNTEITVYKIAVLSSSLESYQVMTTEFGYMGSSNDKNKQGITGLNFSLWSYGANAPIPPHNELSHLIAVGGVGNSFGRYGHEGTGVKPRGFNPYNTPVVNSFTIALRKLPGAIYNTYWCYYFDEVSLEWKLYGSGKKLNSSGNLDYLATTGSFLEVIGPPNVSRSGHRMRTIEIQGWKMQHDGTWNTIDELNPAYGSGSSLSFKEWSQNNTGDAFLFKMGGFFETGLNPGNITLANPPALPFYLQNNYVNQLYSLPADFTTLTPEIYNDNAVLKFNIQNLGTNPDIKIFYGTDYGLTEGIHYNYVIDTVWEEVQNVALSSLNNGVLSVHLTNLIPNTEYYYRLRIKNNEGITWSFNTESFITESSFSSIDYQDKEQLIIFPNPVKSALYIKNKASNGFEARIFNSNGKLVLSQVVKQNKINTHLLKRGVYYLELVNSEKTKTVRFVKE